MRRLNFDKLTIRMIIICVIFAISAVVVFASANRIISNNSQAKLAQSIKPTPSPTIAPTPLPTANPALASPPVGEANSSKLSSVYVKNGVKTAYLTFDDGPTKSITPKILSILSQYNIKASFFVLGSIAESNPSVLRQVYADGHLILNHGYSHNYKIIYKDSESFKNEIRQTEDIIRNILGVSPVKIFRFPGGSFDSYKQKFKNDLVGIGYKYVDWNSIDGDAEGGSKTSEQLLNKVVETAKAEDIVLLMHDAASKKTTVDALPSIIEYLKNQGYQFKLLNQ